MRKKSEVPIGLDEIPAGYAIWLTSKAVFSPPSNGRRWRLIASWWSCIGRSDETYWAGRQRKDGAQR